MTGKDFSGPTPEIHAPVVLSLTESDKPDDNEPSENMRKQSTTPGLAGDGGEVLRDATFFDKDDDV
jgi:transcription factor TFIIIB component B''